MAYDDGGRAAGRWRSSVRNMATPCATSASSDYSKRVVRRHARPADGRDRAVVIVGEESSAAGVRRIEAMTGVPAIEYIGAMQAMVGKLAAEFRARPEELPAKIQALRDQVRAREREAEALRAQVARATVGDLVARAERVNGATVLVARASSDDLDMLGDQLRDRLGQSVIVLGAVSDGKPRLLALVAPEVVQSGVRAGDIIREAAPVIGGRGGGRPERAQGGGTNADALDAALATARRHIHEALKTPQEE